jgi:hypothetical protein
MAVNHFAVTVEGSRRVDAIEATALVAGLAPQRYGRANAAGPPAQRGAPGLGSLETAHWAGSSGQAWMNRQGIEANVGEIPESLEMTPHSRIRSQRHHVL